MPIIGTSNLPVAPSKTPWNPRAAKERIFQACKGNVACLSRGFLQRAEGMDARDPNAYSLGFCDVIDGRLHIIPAGIAAAAGVRGIGAFIMQDSARAQIQARITTIYDRIRAAHPDWPLSPFDVVVADASGVPFQGTIALEGEATGDGRFIAHDALTWELPIPLVFDKAEMDHSGATIGTINEIERREGGIIWGIGALSATEDPETQALITRASELFAEGAVGVSISIDDADSELVDENGKVIDTSGEVDEGIDWEKVVTRVTAARIRSVAIVDEAAFIDARVALAAAVRPAMPDWFSDPAFGDETDERLVWQEPERPEEERQLGCPLTITEDGRVYGHIALWGRCHVGYPGTCVRPPKEPAAYRGFLTGERLPGVPTGPLVMRTTHASLKVGAEAASAHYDHTGYAVADITIGPDALGIWAAGAIRSDASEADIDMLRGSALSGDWRVIGGQMRLVGVLVVNAPGFRVSRAMAASGAMLTVGPGCSVCDEESSLEDRVAELERLLASMQIPA